MAEVVNLAPLVNQINRVADTTYRIEAELAQTNARLDAVTDDLRSLSYQLNGLKDSFEAFVNDSKRATTLQKAATELIRVRQELEQNFGGYKVVRETMLGVLQATDLALVKKTTISQVTEELMLSTPDYWLAPCLVAVAAWIGNDRDLADRAIREAVKRDEEKTALTMALICRRNNRSDACFEWLAIYFAKQSSEHFTESNFTYLNAYLNGVFGPDEKHMCEDYVAKWMREIQGHGEDFVREQTELWKEYCSEFTVDLEGQFPYMTHGVREYADIAAYVSRINSVGKISSNFSSIKNVVVDDEKLKKDIDQTLVTLISRCDEKEEPLRKEERYLQAIRYFDGDTEAAKRSVLEADRKRTEQTIDLVGQMTNTIIKTDAHPSERKTSVSFLSSYIRSGFQEYIAEKKPSFPQQITLDVDGWTGMTVNGTNADALHQGYEMHMRKECQEALGQIKSDAPKKRLILAGIIGVLAIILMFAVHVVVGIIGLVGAGICALTSRSVDKANKQRSAETVAMYKEKVKVGHRRIDEILSEWRKAQAIVAGFESEELPDVVA